MRFGDVARWTIPQSWDLSADGDAADTRLPPERLLKKRLPFEDMQIPLGVVATDLRSGKPYAFRDHGANGNGDSAGHALNPGLFTPFEVDGRSFVDGAITVEVPSALAHMMGATHVISGFIPNQDETADPCLTLAQVISRSFQIMISRSEEGWRRYSDLVINADVWEPGFLGWVS